MQHRREGFGHIHAYFALQRRLLERHAVDFGLPLWALYALGPLLFIGASFLLFRGTAAAPWIFAMMALTWPLRLSERGHNDFLATCFHSRDLRLLRLLENATAVSPFVVFLGTMGHFFVAFAVFLASLCLSFFSASLSSALVLPTPFSKRPFEFLVGFRRYFVVLLAAYLLVAVAVWVPNFNIGIFCLMLVFALCMAFYGPLESPYFVWVHTLSSSAFLWHKARVALLHATLLAGPVCLALGVFFPENALIVLAVSVFGYAYLLATVFAKYATHPRPLGIPQAILLGISMVLPPLLLVTVPFFYKKSVENLRYTLP
jgi:hypothetical protein